MYACCIAFKKNHLLWVDHFWMVQRDGIDLLVTGSNVAIDSDRVTRWHDFTSFPVYNLHGQYAETVSFRENIIGNKSFVLTYTENLWLLGETEEFSLQWIQSNAFSLTTERKLQQGNWTWKSKCEGSGFSEGVQSKMSGDQSGDLQAQVQKPRLKIKVCDTNFFSKKMIWFNYLSLDKNAKFLFIHITTMKFNKLMSWKHLHTASHSLKFYSLFWIFMSWRKTSKSSKLLIVQNMSV